MQLKEFKISISKEVSEAFLETLDSLEITNYYENLFDSEKTKNNNEILSEHTEIFIFLLPEDNESELKVRITLETLASGNFNISSRLLESKEYEEAYKEFYKPLRFGKSLFLIPVWEKNNPDIQKKVSLENLIPVYLNPGFSFGTGHHETTKMILDRIDSIPLKDCRVLDCGTGSGILSMAAFSLGAEKVTAFDIDPLSIRSASENYIINGFHRNKSFRLLEGGFDDSDIFDDAFGIVFCNITFAVIERNIEKISKINSKRFLFSGIISEKKDEAIQLFSDKLKGKMEWMTDLNGWVLIDWMID